MNFSQLKESFEQLKDFTSQSTKRLCMLAEIFEDLKDAEEKYANRLGLISQKIKDEVSVENESITLQGALISLERFIFQQSSLHRHLSQNYATQINQKLSSFIKDYDMTLFETIAKADILIDKFLDGRVRLEKRRAKYFKRAAVAERAEQIMNLEDQADRLEKSKTNCIKAKELSDNSLVKYIKSYEAESVNWIAYCEELPKYLMELQAAHTSRIEISHEALQKLHDLNSVLPEVLIESLKELGESCSIINAQQDIEYIVNSYRQPEVLEKERLIVYEEYKRTMRRKGYNPLPQDNSYIVSQEEAYTPLNPDIALVKTIVYELCPLQFSQSQKPNKRVDAEIEYLDQNLIASMNKLLSSKEGRALFLDTLDSRKRACVLSYQNLEQLALLIDTFLCEMVKEGDYDYNIFHRIVTIAHVYYTSTEYYKFYLYEFLPSNPIWQSQERWLEAIQHTISNRKQAEKESFNRNRSLLRKKKWKMLFKPKVKLNITNFNDEKCEKTCTITVLSLYNYYMSNLHVKLEMAEQVVMHHCIKSKLEVDKTTVAVAELWCRQKWEGQFHYKNKFARSLKLRAKERARWGDFLPIGLCCEYLNTSELILCLQVNKNWKLHIESYLFRRLLILKQEPISNPSEIRKAAWLKILSPNHQIKPYRQILSEVRDSPKSIKSYEDIIAMDIIRCYASQPKVSPMALQDLLKAFAYYNQDVGYCQGMNYLAGTLYYLLQDEENAFICMVGLFEKFHLDTIYSPDLPRLKLLLYQLDRVISILMPDVHKLFRIEMIEAGHFASSWFISLFAVLLQNKPELLIDLWSWFLFDGWKVIFKAIIAVIQLLEPQIQKKNFDDILLVVTALQNSQCPNDLFPDNFLDLVSKVKVTNSLLGYLQAEYREIVDRVKKNCSD